MKKAITLVLALVLALSLSACGGKDNNSTPSGNGGNSNTPSTPQNNGNDTTPNDNGGGEEWPDNKWTQYMPKPTGELSDDPTENVPGSTSSTCWFTIVGGREDAKAYVEQLIAYGYTVDPEPLVSVSETEQEYSWEGISPAIDEVYYYYITVHHFVSEFRDSNSYDIIISNHK